MQRGFIAACIFHELVLQNGFLSWAEDNLSSLHHQHLLSPSKGNNNSLNVQFLRNLSLASRGGVGGRIDYEEQVKYVPISLTIFMRYKNLAASWWRGPTTSSQSLQTLILPCLRTTPREGWQETRWISIMFTTPALAFDLFLLPPVPPVLSDTFFQAFVFLVEAFLLHSSSMG